MTNPLNHCHFIGRVCKEPDMQYLPNGTAKASIRLAVDRTVKVAETGSYETKTSFFSVSAFGKLAEFAAKYLKAGALIAVDSAYAPSSVKREDGGYNNYPNFNVESLKVLKWPKRKEGEEDADEKAEADEENLGKTFDDDEIPF